MRRWAQHAHGLDLPHYAVSHRPRPRHRPGRAALPGRRTTTRRGDVRRRLDRQGRDRPRTRRRAVAGDRRLRPATSRCWPTRAAASRTFGTRDDFLDPVRLPELHRVRPGLAHRAATTRLIGPGRLPRREVLPRARRRRRLRRLPRRGHRRAFAEVADGVAADWPALQRRRPRADLGRLGRGRADQRGVRHRRRQPGQARRRRDDPGAAAPGAVAGAGPPGRRRRPGARPAAGRAARRAGRGGRRPAVHAASA